MFLVSSFLLVIFLFLVLWPLHFITISHIVSYSRVWLLACFDRTSEYFVESLTLFGSTHTHTHTHTEVASKLYIYARFVGCCSSNLQWNHRGHEWWVSLLTVDWLSSIQLSRIFIFFCFISVLFTCYFCWIWHSWCSLYISFVSYWIVNYKHSTYHMMSPPACWRQLYVAVT